MIVMPISRHHVLSLGRANAYVNLPRPVVELINRIQAVAAIREVVWDSEADMQSFVHEILSESAVA